MSLDTTIFSICQEFVNLTLVNFVTTLLVRLSKFCCEVRKYGQDFEFGNYPIIFVKKYRHKKMARLTDYYRLHEVSTELLLWLAKVDKKVMTLEIGFRAGKHLRFENPILLIYVFSRCLNIT